MPERRVGPRQVLLGLYAVFVVAAGARSTVQLTIGNGAMLAYSLSAVAAASYLVGFLLVAFVGRGVPARVAAAWAGLELAGVVAVGTASVLLPEHFPDATVWSTYGSGYVFLPVLLPLAVLGWLWADHPWSLRRGARSRGRRLLTGPRTPRP